MINRYLRLCLILSVIFLSACHSKKYTVRSPNGQAVAIKRPYEIEKPKREIAEKYAEIMGVKRSDIKNGKLYSFIDDWYGTPYRFGGLNKDGVDCSGLVVALQSEVFNTTLPRTCAMQVNVIKRKYEEDLKEGDLVFFDFDGKEFSHVGVYLQNGYIVHASTRKGVIVVRLHDNGIYQYFSRGGSIMDTTSAQNN